jgi:hypothetical protein
MRACARACTHWNRICSGYIRTNILLYLYHSHMRPPHVLMHACIHNIRHLQHTYTHTYMHAYILYAIYTHSLIHACMHTYTFYDRTWSCMYIHHYTHVHTYIIYAYTQAQGFAPPDANRLLMFLNLELQVIICMYAFREHVCELCLRIHVGFYSARV